MNKTGTSKQAVNRVVMSILAGLEAQPLTKHLSGTELYFHPDQSHLVGFSVGVGNPVILCSQAQVTTVIRKAFNAGRRWGSRESQAADNT